MGQKWWIKAYGLCLAFCGAFWQPVVHVSEAAWLCVVLVDGVKFCVWRKDTGEGTMETVKHEWEWVKCKDENKNSKMTAMKEKTEPTWGRKAHRSFWTATGWNAFAVMNKISSQLYTPHPLESVQSAFLFLLYPCTIYSIQKSSRGHIWL